MKRERTELVADELLDLLRTHADSSALTYIETPVPLTGGFWAELWTFHLRAAPPGLNGHLVARVMPNEDIAAKEAVVQAEVARQGYPTPEVHLYRGPDTGIEGRAVMVMDLAPGHPLLAGLDGVGAIARLPRLARQLPAALADVLARLHRLDPTPVEAGLSAAGCTRPSLDAMLQHLADENALLGAEGLVQATRWLAGHRPSEGPDVICHGDMHPFNLLVDDDGRPTVLDWSAPLLSPPTYDLAFTSVVLAEPPLVVPPPLRPAVRAAGRALSRRFLTRYERLSGERVDPAALSWHQGLICLRALTEVAHWTAAGVLHERAGHPWVIAGTALAARLQALTGARLEAESLRSL